MQGTWVSQRIRFGGDGMNASVRAPRWLSALAGLLLAGTAAATPPLSLGSYQHTAFQKQEGAPGDIASLAQTADGFLWMTGTKGVTRFDGVTFQPFRPVPGEAFRAAQLNGIFPAQGPTTAIMVPSPIPISAIGAHKPSRSWTWPPSHSNRPVSATATDYRKQFAARRLPAMGSN